MTVFVMLEVVKLVMMMPLRTVIVTDLGSIRSRRSYEAGRDQNLMLV